MFAQKLNSSCAGHERNPKVLNYERKLMDLERGSNTLDFDGKLEGYFKFCPKFEP